MRKFFFGTMVVVAGLFLFLAVATEGRTDIPNDGLRPNTTVISILAGYDVNLVCKDDEKTCKNNTAVLDTFYLDWPFPPMTTWAIQNEKVEEWLVTHDHLTAWPGAIILILLLAATAMYVSDESSKRRHQSPCPGNCGCDGNCGDRCKCK